VVAIAAKAGFSISAEEVQAAQLSQLPNALSDDDVDGVAGGSWTRATQAEAVWGFMHP
jgi:predicted ribosomally synthesized peptide with nif11-like leader